MVRRLKLVTHSIKGTNMKECKGHACYGGGVGTAVAAVVSWSVNHSILWALVHAFFGWLYLAYYALGFGR